MFTSSKWFNLLQEFCAPKVTKSVMAMLVAAH
jgi:hypothetical protein